MNAKTVKILRKYANLKGLDVENLKREWLSLNEFEKNKKRQEYLAALSKK